MYTGVSYRIFTPCSWKDGAHPPEIFSSHAWVILQTTDTTEAARSEAQCHRSIAWEWMLKHVRGERRRVERCGRDYLQSMYEWPMAMNNRVGLTVGVGGRMGRGGQSEKYWDSCNRITILKILKKKTEECLKHYFYSFVKDFVTPLFEGRDPGFPTWFRCDVLSAEETLVPRSSW